MTNMPLEIESIKNQPLEADHLIEFGWRFELWRDHDESLLKFLFSNGSRFLGFALAIAMTKNIQ